MKCIFITAFQRFINYITFFKNELQRRAQARTAQAAYRPCCAGEEYNKSINIIAEYLGLLMINIEGNVDSSRSFTFFARQPRPTRQIRNRNTFIYWLYKIYQFYFTTYWLK